MAEINNKLLVALGPFESRARAQQAIATAPMHLLALINPPLENTGAQLVRGIVRDPTLHRAVCDDIAAFAATLGCAGIDVFPSQITGDDGNAEFFFGARRG